MTRPTSRPLAPTTVVPAGTFVRGDDHHYPEEAPAREVHVEPFRIDLHQVTNAQFRAFVDDTGHVTVAERTGGSVFVPAAAPVDLAQPSLWWRHDGGATWRRPRGHDLTTDHDDHPVVQIARDDARAYATWAGGRLATEDEWEWAAGAGGPLPVRWPLASDGRLLANVWLGEFPWKSVRRDAPGTMPVGSFAPNPFGPFDMLGNVWEWTSDDWDDGSGVAGVAGAVDSGVVKGGSFLCAANHCSRYRPAARHRQRVDEAACHIGFRCAYPI